MRIELDIEKFLKRIGRDVKEVMSVLLQALIVKYCLYLYSLSQCSYLTSQEKHSLVEETKLKGCTRKLRGH